MNNEENASYRIGSAAGAVAGGIVSLRRYTLASGGTGYFAGLQPHFVELSTRSCPDRRRALLELAHLIRTFCGQAAEEIEALAEKTAQDMELGGGTRVDRQFLTITTTLVDGPASYSVTQSSDDPQRQIEAAALLGRWESAARERTTSPEEVAFALGEPASVTVSVIDNPYTIAKLIERALEAAAAGAAGLRQS